MLSLRNMTYSHLKLVFLTILSQEKAYKWISPK